VTILNPKVATLHWRIEGKTTEYSKDKIGGEPSIGVLFAIYY
jgi:hypothetical protein